MKVPDERDDLVLRTPASLCDPVVVKAWDDFKTLHPRKKDCLDEIVRMLIDSGLLHCEVCETPNWTASGERMVSCSGCSGERSATAGTFFHHMRSPRAWLAAIWLTERGIILSSLSFQKLLNIAYSSARSIQQRVRAAMEGPMQDDQDTVQVPTSLFMKLFRRRSSETPARQSPKAEDEAYMAELSVRRALSPPSLEIIGTAESTSQAVIGNGSCESEIEVGRDELLKPIIEKLPDEQRLLLDLLNQQSLSSDQLASKTGLPIGQVNACLSMLEMDDLCKRLPGNYFFAASRLINDEQRIGLKRLSAEETISIDLVSEFISEKYKGVSRKHLQMYLIAHWCSVRQRDHDGQAVLAACLKLGKKTDKEIFSRVTSKIVRIRKFTMAA